MELKEAREIVADCKKSPADKWDEAVALCIADDDEAVDEEDDKDVDEVVE